MRGQSQAEMVIKGTFHLLYTRESVQCRQGRLRLCSNEQERRLLAVAAWFGVLCWDWLAG